MQNSLIAIFAVLAATFLFLWLRQKRAAAMNQLTNQVKLADQKEELETEQERLLNALNDALFLIDPDGIIIFANESTVDLVAGRLLLGRHIKEVFLDDRITTAMEKSLETGRAIIQQIVLPSQASPRGISERRGETSWVIDAAPLDRNTEQKITRVVVRDVTLEHQSEQVRKDFVANASHELRTPLSIINGYLENLVEGEIEDPEFLQRSLVVMKKHGDRIAHIVEDMLMISRLESGSTLSLNMTEFLFASCIQDVLERLESVFTEQGAQPQILIPDPDTRIYGDRFYWTQVFFNLIENALKQNPSAPLQIEIGSQFAPDGSLKLWVADDGVGIPSSDIPFIFRRFYRVEKHHNTDSIKGTGLGLSIVRRSVEAHQGTISVSSVPGQRTAFEIVLPPSSHKTAEATTSSSGSVENEADA